MFEFEGNNKIDYRRMHGIKAFLKLYAHVITTIAEIN